MTSRPKIRARFDNLKWAGALGAVALAALTWLHGCSSDSEDSSKPKQDAGQDVSQGGAAGNSGDAQVDVKANCELVGQSCASHSDCCSANCDPNLNACTNPAGSCKGAGESCSAATECCTVVCKGGTCGDSLCTSDGEACTDDAQCCGGSCATPPDGGSAVCIPLNGTCKTSGNSCTTDGECCSKLCGDNGTCSLKPSFCTQTGDICAVDTDCCTGLCTKTGSATVGTCTQPSAPGTTGCLVAGEVCGGSAADGGVGDGGLPACGGACCSRSCAPYGPTGVFVCQPPSGCRPTGEVCLSDSDCCGSAGLPGGNGSVKCSKGPGENVGRCDNGTSCRPAGAVCKLASSSCNAENNCCAGNVNTDPTVCQQDLLGIPRCTGVGDCADAGALEGQACATSADCCGLPCLPNNAGADGGPTYVCGGSTCVPADGACTTDADCCAGLPCVAPPGSTQGKCGATVQDGGTPQDAGTCALYGQECSGNADCCNNVPCLNGHCVIQ